MEQPWRIYECMLDYCSSKLVLDRLSIGLVWTVSQTRLHKRTLSGLAMTPVHTTRTLDWPGTLSGRNMKDIAQWVRQWEPFQATVGMSAINCCINASRSLPKGELLEPVNDQANLSVFDYFLPKLQNRNVVVIGHYPGIETYVDQYGWQVIERNPGKGDIPDPACEFLLPEADWVFLTASSLTNKTFPRLAELSSSAKTVLMGPGTPWLLEFQDFGIDYLAGVEIVEAEKLYHTAAEGGGVRIFEQGVRYKIVELDNRNGLAWMKNLIAETYAEKERLTQAMNQWYTNGNNNRFPHYTELDETNTRLSRMDSVYKRLWDARPSVNG